MDNFSAWHLMIELRKELVETQKIRTQIIGFKITVVSALISLISAINLKTLIFQENADSPADYLLVVLSFSLPAFCSIFFDFLCDGCSLRIHRIGEYCRTVLEPVIRENTTEKDLFKLWEEHLEQKKDGDKKVSCLLRFATIGFLLLSPKSPWHNPSYLGNSLLTAMTVVVALATMLWGSFKLVSLNGNEIVLVLLIIIGIFILLILILMFMIRLWLYGHYYHQYHDYKRSKLDELLNETLKKVGEEEIIKQLNQLNEPPKQ